MTYYMSSGALNSAFTYLLTCDADEVEEHDDEEVEPPSKKCPRSDPSDDAEESLPSLQVIDYKICNAVQSINHNKLL